MASETPASRETSLIVDIIFPCAGAASRQNPVNLNRFNYDQRSISISPFVWKPIFHFSAKHRQIDRIM
ncbi:hypothetical protein LNQ03_17945 [Klebsiella pneumoniae subsp. pneumoniae]|nr:hypothetical protein [Klebsiella pneumoniae subsp. pneumoniae]